MQWARLAITGVTIAVCAAACADVLDIEDPKVRPSEAGASGEPATGATGSGGSNSTSGNGGASTLSTAGQGGQAGEAVGGNAPDAGAGGEAGAPSMKDCQPNAVQCAGPDAKSPQICDETGHWVANRAEAAEACPTLCAAGKCTECSDGDKRCTVCANDAVGCDTNLPQTCVAGVWTNDKKSCAQFCQGEGECVTTPSCGAAGTTVTTCSGEESCCRSFLVPGGSYDRFDEDSDVPLPTNVGPFFLDKFEVTVGRFRQFVTAYAEVLTATLKEGAGKSDHVVGDSGWNSDFVMPVDKATLATDLKSCAGATWSDDVLTNNTLPLNCVSFNVAYGFCIWDEARLPTEAEWQFAAGGGDQRRTYPWLPPVAGPDISHTYANYAETGDDSSIPLDVGSTPLGNGRWGQADLAGNVREWTLDYFHPPYPTSCTNCLDTTASSERSQRGGAYSSPSDALFVASHTGVQPELLRAYSGFRCARDRK